MVAFAKGKINPESKRVSFDFSAQLEAHNAEALDERQLRLDPWKFEEHEISFDRRTFIHSRIQHGEVPCLRALARYQGFVKRPEENFFGDRARAKAPLTAS
jgi:hypothetical protein